MTDGTAVAARPHNLDDCSLAQLAEMANEEARLSEAHLSQALDHAIRCGERLAAAKLQLTRDDWPQWLDNNFARTAQIAYICIRLAHYQSLLPADVTGIAAARSALSGLPAVRDFADDPAKETAMDLVASGKSVSAVAKQLGVAPTVVLRWCDPERYKARRDEYIRRQNARRAERLAAARALRNEQRAAELSAAAKVKGGSLAKLYSLTRQQLAALDSALAEAGSREERYAIEETARAARVVEKRLASALRASRQD